MNADEKQLPFKLARFELLEPFPADVVRVLARHLGWLAILNTFQEQGFELLLGFTLFVIEDVFAHSGSVPSLSMSRYAP